jgi:hypothetical protein
VRWIDLPGLVHATRLTDAAERGDAPPSKAASAARLLLAAVGLSGGLPRPIFVLGSPRSGTTFLGDCLAATGVVDYHFEPLAIKRANRHVIAGEWSDRRARYLYRLIYRTLVDTSGRYRCFADKTPRNCFIVDRLARWFPDARFVLINRDGRDVAVSLREKDWYLASPPAERHEAGGEACGPHPRPWVPAEEAEAFRTMSDIRRCASVWRHHTAAALGQLERVEPQRQTAIRYEQLVARPRETAGELAAFLELDDEAAQRLERACGEARTGSVGRWRQALCDEEAGEVTEEAGELLRRLGYL